jgi:hypothetical protein
MGCLREIRMHGYKFAWAMSIALLCTARMDSQGARADAPAEKKKGAMLLSRSGSPKELAARIEALLSSSPTKELDRLVADADCAVALAAGWERVRRTVREAEQQEPVNPDGQAISRFLGLVEGRLQIPLPQAWEASVRSAMAYGRRAIWFSWPELAERSFALHTPVREGDRWMVVQSGRPIKLAVEDRDGPVGEAAVLSAGGTVYVALYGSRPAPFGLLAVNRDDSGVIGRYEVWAAGGLTAFEGKGWHHVEMRVTGQALTVFGISDGAVYIEVFDRKTGENRCRFSTAYFDFDAVTSRK